MNQINLSQSRTHEQDVSSKNLDRLIKKVKNLKDIKNYDNKEKIKQINELMKLLTESKDNKPIPTQLAKELQTVVWKACTKEKSP